MLLLELWCEVQINAASPSEQYPPGWAATVYMRWPGHAQLQLTPSDDRSQASDSAFRAASALKSRTSRRRSASASAAGSCFFFFPFLVLHRKRHTVCGGSHLRWCMSKSSQGHSLEGAAVRGQGGGGGGAGLKEQGCTSEGVAIDTSFRLPGRLSWCRWPGTAHPRTPSNATHSCGHATGIAAKMLLP